ncbi:glycosyltransferase [Lactobacillus hominis]|uniref:glycosyltransferase n=1 Tax=Lactobacillus hominis TaxID=1203033 RepID=UPI0023F35A59|nr:glycosyltransferase [Lactobacillus hominis]
MKILEVFGEPILYGGQESFVFRTIKNMNRNRLHFDFLTPYYVNNPTYTKFIKSINSKLFCFHLPFKAGKNRFNVIKPYCKLLDMNHYDIVHIHSGSISILALLAMYSKKKGVKKVIVHSHMAGENKNVKHEIIKTVYSPIFKYYADILIAPTKKAAYWQFSKNLFKKKGYIVKNGIEVDRYTFNSQLRDIYRKKLGYSPENIVIGHVGRFSSEKNHEQLIHLLKYAVNYNKDMRLLLVGGGTEENKIKKSILDNKLQDFVRIVEDVNNVWAYLQAMDIFVFPSKYEGLGIASIEAQAAGLPVLASSRVPKDIKVTKNVNFLDIDSSIKNWYSNLNEMLKNNRRDENVTQQISKNGYSIKQTAKDLRNIYLR